MTPLDHRAIAKERLRELDASLKIIHSRGWVLPRELLDALDDLNSDLKLFADAPSGPVYCHMLERTP